MVEISDYRGSGESILVVDDAQEQRVFASTILTKLGYAVSTASSGREALVYLNENRVDLVMLDMVMEPDMDGLDTYRKILEITPGQKAIIISGFSESDRIREAMKLGVRECLLKPYTIDKIAKTVKHVLND